MPARGRIRSAGHLFILLINIVSDYCPPGCPKRFVIRLSAPMCSREVPAERSEHLHLVNLPLSSCFLACRHYAGLASPIPIPQPRIPLLDFRQVLALIGPNSLYPASLFLNTYLILFVLKMCCNHFAIISRETTLQPPAKIKKSTIPHLKTEYCRPNPIMPIPGARPRRYCRRDARSPLCPALPPSRG